MSSNDRQESSSIDRHPPFTCRVWLPIIDVARLNAFRHPSKPSETSIDNNQQSEDAPEPMVVELATVGRTLRKRKKKVIKHLKREASDKEMDNFTKRVLRIPLDKPFDEAYFTHRLWKFFRETKQNEKDIERIFHQREYEIRDYIEEEEAFKGFVHFYGLFSKELRRNHQKCRIPDPELDRWDGHGSRKRTSQSGNMKTSIPWPRKKVKNIRKLRLNLIRAKRQLGRSRDYSVLSMLSIFRTNNVWNPYAGKSKSGKVRKSKRTAGQSSRGAADGAGLSELPTDQVQTNTGGVLPSDPANLTGTKQDGQQHQEGGEEEMESSNANRDGDQREKMADGTANAPAALSREDLIEAMKVIGAVFDMQTNKLCLTLIDPNVYYDPIPSYYVSRPYSPAHSYIKDNIEELIYDIETWRYKMFDEFYRHIDDVYFRLLNPVAALERQMEALKMKIDSLHETIQRQQDHITKGEDAIKIFVGAVFDMQTNKLCLTLIDPNVYYDPELDNGASIDTQPKLLIDGMFKATIDSPLEAPIDTNSANEIYDFP
ncbi:hypothetical protein F2Q70_00030103 [Brassica cretica]|uniref:Uncharacterized protein n=1 Tax=Brassica cretica TaxID=69181 RepID=A0A8S9FHZ2_BRACR|nr:hypothetical protein F2Q70_00030103 [Brassica cretica]